MKLKSIFLAFALLFLPISLIAKSDTNTTCTKGLVCVDSSDFIAEVIKVRNRGTIATVQIRFISKIKKLSMYFGNYYHRHALLVDANGQDIKINGDAISGFELKQGAKQVVSFTFKSKDKKPIAEPFDVTVKSRDYEVTFFDLKTKSSKQSKDDNITQN